MKLTIRVTEQDIRKGLVTETDCPIARAANRALGEAGLRGPADNPLVVKVVPYIGVSDTGIFLCRLLGRCVGKVPADDLPDGMIEWAADFDDWCASDRRGDCPVCPETFVVELPLEGA